MFFTLADITNDLNVELSRVVCELESALERKPLPLEATNEVFIETLTTSSATMNENTLQVITVKNFCLIVQTLDILKTCFRSVINCFYTSERLHLM